MGGGGGGGGGGDCYKTQTRHSQPGLVYRAATATQIHFRSDALCQNTNRDGADDITASAGRELSSSRGSYYRASEASEQLVTSRYKTVSLDGVNCGEES